MQARYATYLVMYEHTMSGSDTVRPNFIMLCCYGRSEHKFKFEIQRERPDHRNVVILEVTQVHP